MNLPQNVQRLVVLNKAAAAAVFLKCSEVLKVSPGTGGSGHAQRWPGDEELDSRGWAAVPAEVSGLSTLTLASNAWLNPVLCPSEAYNRVGEQVV